MEDSDEIKQLLREIRDAVLLAGAASLRADDFSGAWPNR
jgi:hypothetical protein